MAGSFQVRLFGTTLEYWSLLGGYRALKQDEIVKARIEIGSSSYGDDFVLLSGWRYCQTG